MAADSTIQAKVQLLDQGNRICVASGGTLEVASGATLVGLVPAPPTDDGDYKLTITGGVPTWVALT